MYVGDLVRLSKSGIDLKTTGAITIQTTENGGQRFIPIGVIVECTAASGITIGATVSVGVTGAGYTDILAASVLTGVTAANNILMFNVMTAVGSSIAANTAIKVNVSVAATGTSQTARVDVLGYYV